MAFPGNKVFFDIIRLDDVEWTTDENRIYFPVAWVLLAILKEIRYSFEYVI